jgi:hypothetical protein
MTYLIPNVYREGDRWFFDDPAMGIEREELVQGADKVLTQLANGATVGRVAFSDEPFDLGTGFRYYGPTKDNWSIYDSHLGCVTAFLCPTLLRYFDRPPADLYVRFISLA